MIKQPKLKEYYRVLEADISDKKNINLILGASHSTARQIEGDISILTLLDLCDGSKNLETIYQILRKDYDVSIDDLNEAIKNLEKEGILEEGSLTSDVLTSSEMDRYARHLVYYSSFEETNKYEAQEKLKNSHVTLIGMGGIGNWISLNLVASGVGTIRGVDPDDVELSNLTRQILFDEKDIGGIKVEKAKKRLESLNSNVNFEAIPEKMNGVESVKKVIAGTDIVVLSADSPEHIHYWIDQACFELGIPWTNVGYVDSWGVCGPLVIPNKTSCLICDMKTREVKQDRLYKNAAIQSINERMHAPSYGPLNGLVSCVAAMEIIKFLTGYETPTTIGRRWNINSGTMEIEVVDYPRDPECIQCGK